ncbi:cobalamin trafficking protein CblD-like [Diorhabda carinulata]|uniref:cobalamin trafficking protein CblD-like n=1 Tax=Diorhabda sublineata TaxID=1163346 RepID=UPI0024E0A9B5|nr:cobalamin trafficking protein CblD-like [Diorhabda sublineata]XP_057653944.1 cobalamin trafficking protein CblD-like [Diorhabda carinulata]
MSSKYFSLLQQTLIKSKDRYNIFRNYSRKIGNGSTTDSSYKHVKPKESVDDSCNLVWRDPSYELLAATEFPLFLRGNIGLAWYDTQTTVKSSHELVLEQIDDGSNEDMVVRFQTCPTLLRQIVKDLFPYRTQHDNGDLSVVTIAMKPNIKDMRKNKELENEKLAQTFLMAAKNICDKLRNVGYWADFINPFSGRPYFSPFALRELYQNDENFRCLDFQIIDFKDCKVISNEEDSKRQFIGSLFTSAPANNETLNSIFS